MQIAERGIARAEIVDGKLNSQCPKLSDLPLDYFGRIDQQAFGELEFEIPGGDPVALESFCDGSREVRAADLDGRNVHRDRHVADATLLPIGHLPANLVEHPVAEGN